jgi:simple sugar transport system permease protein
MAWALIPAFLRARGRVNEILSTLLFNYLAASLLSWSLRTWLRNPDAVATLQSKAIEEDARIPLLLAGTRLHWGAVIVVVVAIGLALWMRTPLGFGFDLHGERPAVAARMGISQTRAVLVTMLVSGAAAGIAGWLQVAGTTGRLYTSVAGGLGFAGLAVAVVGRLRPVGVCVAAVVFAALSTGSDGLQAGTQVPASFAQVLQALLLLAGAVGAVMLTRRNAVTS